jgi:hypothetical protein
MTGPAVISRQRRFAFDLEYSTAIGQARRMSATAVTQFSESLGPSGQQTQPPWHRYKGNNSGSAGDIMLKSRPPIFPSDIDA